VLTLQALGEPQLSILGQPARLRGKPLALLCWLALRGEGAPRAEALDLLWPCVPGQDDERSARHSLRQSLYTLRKLPQSAHWLRDGETLGVEALTDVQELRLRLARDLACALPSELARPLLAGLEGMPEPFTEWLEIERQKLELWRRTLLFQRALDAQAAGQLAEAATRLSELLALDPLHESAVQALMRLEAARGRPAQAQVHFEALREVLRREMNAEPLPQTLELARTLQGPALTPAPLNADLLLLTALDVLGEADAPLIAQMLERPALTVAAGLDALEGQGQTRHGRLVPNPARPLNPNLHALLSLRLARALQARGESGDEERAGLHLLHAGRAHEAVETFLKLADDAADQYDIIGAARLGYRALWAGAGGLDWARATGCIFELAHQRRQVDDMKRLSAALERLAANEQRDELFFQLHHQRAVEASNRYNYDLALTEAREALNLARRLNNPERLGEARATLGRIHVYRSELELAEVVLRESLSSPEPRASAKVQLQDLTLLGTITRSRGDLVQALTLFEQALAQARATGHRGSVARTLHTLANVACDAEQYEQGVRGYREAAHLFRSLGQTRLETISRATLSTVYALLGRCGEAYNTACEALEDSDNSLAAVQALSILGNINLRSGRLREARRHFLGMREQSLTVQSRRHVLFAELYLGMVDRCEGRPDYHLTERIAELQPLGPDASVRGMQGMLARTAQSAAQYVAILPPSSHPSQALYQARAYLRGWVAQPPTLDALEAIATILPGELPYALSLQAALLEHSGQSECTRLLRQQAIQRRTEQAAGLPRRQRLAFLNWDATSPDWVTVGNEDESS
jgi:DNA-binding SARP family transcriptional activator